MTGTRGPERVCRGLTAGYHHILMSLSYICVRENTRQELGGEDGGRSCVTTDVDEFKFTGQYASLTTIPRNGNMPPTASPQWVGVFQTVRRDSSRRCRVAMMPASEYTLESHTIRRTGHESR
ncbi:hypothetical protein PAXRUDRAFT_660368 [Paxillus rubicundulus Ve08.2h10]|uniref:Uncharacterized protein n=1 Tax=Paxillus rubicundulus Ve08.2h10 TaxID=930991 RepID=A0A0D0DV99_9AGAM|nr:hypothetical protein PAXRUDRAFT_660368 [Paxillus rubicundulus Ve08.2h10]